MTTYKCTNSFTSSNKINYSYGSKISSTVYNQLPYSERRNFTMMMDEDASSSSSWTPSFDTPSFDTPSFDTPSYDSGSNDSSPSSDDSFGGFSGGDFGGGGASGDY